MFYIINKKENTVEDTKRHYKYDNGRFFRNGKEVIKATPDGYLRIDIDNKRMLQHRLVIKIEYPFLSDYELSRYDIHHISGIKWDNHPNNLLVCDKSLHSRLHGLINKLNKLGKSQLNSRLYKFSVNRQILTENDYNKIIEEVLA